jgi:formate transporter
MADPSPLPAGYDPKLSAPEVHRTISALGIQKANTAAWQLFLLAVLAGLYISLGGHVALVALEQGMGKLVAGAVFSTGLILVVIAGAELFTGNVTMFVGSVTGLYSFRLLVRNWIIVYLGNFAGAFACAWLIAASGLVGTAGEPNALGTVAVKAAETKLGLGFTAAFIRGFFCNILVILAIILSFFSKDIISKIFCCVFPIMAFVASGYEHCVANMYIIPLGLFAKGASAADFAGIHVNLVPVTLGNIAGGIFIMMAHPNRIRQVVTLYRHRKRTTGKPAA